jgi:plasmid replication initiation protein
MFGMFFFVIFKKTIQRKQSPILVTLRRNKVSKRYELPDLFGTFLTDDKRKCTLDEKSTLATCV